jgi:hypothetical protein
VFAQANLFKTPIAWLPDFAMLIIDESPLRAALLEPDVLFADDMLEMPVSDQEEPGRHGEMRTRLDAALRKALPEGESGPVPLPASALRRQGFDADSAKAARRFERQRTIDKGPWEERGANKSIDAMTRFWRVVEDFLASRQAMTGRLSVGQDPNGRLFVRVLGYSVVDEHFRVPTIMLDATGNQTLLRAYWPQVEFRDRYRIEAPNAKFYQIIDKSFAKTSHAPASWEPKSAKGKAEERRKAKLRESMAIFAASVQRVHGSAQMVVSNKGTMAACRAPNHGRPKAYPAAHGSGAGRRLPRTRLRQRPQNARA